MLSRWSNASNSFFSSVSFSMYVRITSTSARPSFSIRAVSLLKRSRTFVAASSLALVSSTTFSIRSTVSSPRAASFMPSFSLPIWTSMFQTISFRRFASTTARSIECFWPSSALAF